MTPLRCAVAALLVAVPVAARQPIVVDHSCTDLSQIPASWLEAAKQDLGWVYGHTSHGSQIEAGADYLSDHVAPPTYRHLRQYMTIPTQGVPAGLRMGADGGWSWNWSQAGFVNRGRAMLDAAHAPAAVKVFMWSWCGEMSDPDVDLDDYLNGMVQLQSEYPDVVFVYMTGHTDDWADATVRANNDAIRAHVQAHGAVLFDFADVERHLPDGTTYAGTPDDSCPWCQPWCDANPGYCPDPAISCAHSHSLLCYEKANAFWWLSARLAGWPGPSEIFSDGFEAGDTTSWSPTTR